MEASSRTHAESVPVKVAYVLAKIYMSKFLPELKPEIEFNYLAEEKLDMAADQPVMLLHPVEPRQPARWGVHHLRFCFLTVLEATGTLVVSDRR